MDWASSEILLVLRFLLPELVAAWIFYGLTSYPKQSEFERIIQALIFTTIIQGCSVITIGMLASFKHGSEMLSKVTGTQDVVALGIAVVFGIIAATAANNDKLHSLLRMLKITKETSFPSEWFGVFSRDPTYVVLHMTGERRIYGWPEEWPSDPSNGYFSISQAEWLTENGNIPLNNVRNILIPAGDVMHVEFMEFGDA